MEKGRKEMELDQEQLWKYANTFIPRFDMYPVQIGTGKYTKRQQLLDLRTVEEHILGKITIGAYALDPDSRASWVCFDADDDERFLGLISLSQKLDVQGVPSYIEPSRRGGHLWLFTPKLPGREARRFARQLISDEGLPETLEIYPKQDRLVTGPGSLVRLPLGIHRKSNRRYHFVFPDWRPLAPTIREQIAILSNPLRVPQVYIDQVLALAPEPKKATPTPQFGELPKGSGETLSEALKATIGVYDFVRGFVDLDERGVGLCPFHDDHAQSFGVNKDGNFWHCFAGCGGGSIIDFWMKWRQVHGQDGSFTETVKELRGMLL